MEALPIKILIGILVASGIFGLHYVVNRPPIQAYNPPPVLVTPSPASSPIDTPTSQPIYKPIVRETVDTPTPNPDPIVSCDVGSNCGGYRQMRQNECRTSVCCQVGNSWSLYPDKQSCTNAQVQALPPESVDTPWPTLTPITPYPTPTPFDNTAFQKQLLQECIDTVTFSLQSSNVPPSNSAYQEEYNLGVNQCHNEYGN